MKPAQLEHLKLIDAHLERQLSIAAKRTPGEWLPDSEEGLVTFVSHESELGFDITPIAEVSLWANIDEPDESYAKGQQEAVANATFIASCAGNAEAGWRAIRAAIHQGTWLMEMDQQGRLSLQDQGATHQMLLDILAAFPLELVKP